MQSRFPGKCGCCGKAFEQGAEIDYDRDSRTGLPARTPGPARGEADRGADESMIELAERLGFRKMEPE